MGMQGQNFLEFLPFPIEGSSRILRVITYNRPPD